MPRISLLGTSALLFEAPGVTELSTQRRIWALAREAETWPEVREAVPGHEQSARSLRRAARAGSRRWSGVWRRPGQAAQPLPLEGRVVELPVVYGGEGGPHLADVVAHTGLDIDEIVAIHTEPVYPVYALGSHPGYCYLGGMDPRIATPRRKVPVLGIPGGAVSIGGAQTGVSASDGPSGWNTIGTTSMSFFDAARDPPALLRPGDSIVFTVAGVIR